jgi:hypothetical protein
MAQPYLDAAQHVQMMIRLNVRFEKIEAAIQHFPALSDDQRAALWLLAFLRSRLGTDRPQLAVLAND